jgi:hypothetical protein
MVWARGHRKVWVPVLVVGVAVVMLTAAMTAGGAPPDRTINFQMVHAQATCLQDASANVTVQSKGPVEQMRVDAQGLPPKTNFDLFVIQVPHAPFGMSWYQGDMETNAAGKASEQFVGRFNIETFIVAPGSVPAPQTHPGIDATTNPATAPVHTYHLGLWFNSPQDAVAAGCPGATTQFNGDQTAGVQVLNTSNAPDTQGPLSQLQG